MIKQKKDSYPEIRHLAINNGDNFCENFTSEIPKGRKKNLGRFFMVMEVTKPADGESIRKNLQSIISKTEQEYYSNEEYTVVDAISNAARKIGPAVKKMCIQNDTNILMGAFGNGGFYFSKYGKIYACLHNEADGLTSINVKNKRKTASKSFSDTTSITLSGSDQILILNEGFSNAFQEENIEDLITSDPVDTFVNFKKYFDVAMAENRLIDSVIFAIIGMQKISPEIVTLPQLAEPEIKTEEIHQLTETPEKTGEEISVNATAIISAIYARLQTIKLPRNKFLNTAIIVLVLFFGIQFYQKVSADNYFEKISKVINDKKSEALVLASANNANDAINKLLEIKNTYATQNESDPRLKELMNSVEQELNKTAKIITIDKPEKISNLSNFGIKFSPRDIFKSGNQLFMTGDDFGLVYKVDLETKQKGFSFFSTVEDRIKNMVESSGFAIFFTEKNKAYLYNAEYNKTSDFDLEKTENQIISFNGKIIDIFDKNSGQIRQLSSNNFREIGKFAISGQIKDIASDSKNIFALNNNNEIIRISGVQQEKILDTNSIPLFGNPDFIIADQNNIYVVDKKQHHIVAISKDGQFLKQLNIENTGEIIDLITEEDRNIFVLTNNAIYKIAIDL